MDVDANDPAAGHYNDSNRAFLQALLARGTITIDDGKKLLAAIFTIHEGKPQSCSSHPATANYSQAEKSRRLT